MKRYLNIFMTFILIITAFSACSKSKDTDTNTISIPDIYNRNIHFGMTEEDVLALESDLTFNTDYSRTGVTTEHSAKCIVSNETIQINNDEATVSYIFLDNILTQIEYNIPINYSKDQIVDAPATQVYNKQVTDLSNIIGLPTETSSDEYTAFNSKISVWDDSILAISIYVIQTTETFSDIEITDNVCITMIDQNLIETFI